MCCLFKNCAKIALIILNIVYLLSGLMMLGFGVAMVKSQSALTLLAKVLPYMPLKPSDDFDLAKILGVSGNVLMVSGIVMIVLGSFTAIVAVGGCVGACLEIKILLISYTLTVGVIMATQVALLIAVIVLPDAMRDTVRLEMTTSLNKFDKDVTLYSNGTMKMPRDPLSFAWTTLQFAANCCGANNYTDYSKSPRSVNISGTTRPATVPVSCCLQNKDCAKKLTLLEDVNYDNTTFSNLDECLKGNKMHITTDNCYDFVYQIVPILQKIGIGFISAFIAQQIFLISLATFIFCFSNKGTI